MYYYLKGWISNLLVSSLTHIPISRTSLHASYISGYMTDIITSNSCTIIRDTLARAYISGYMTDIITCNICTIIRDTLAWACGYVLVVCGPVVVEGHLSISTGQVCTLGGDTGFLIYQENV
jgi:hypothetical protein